MKILTKSEMFRIQELGNRCKSCAHMVCAVVLMRLEYLMSSKAGKPAKEFWCTNAPTFGPGIKSMGAQMCLQHAKG